MNRHTGQLVWLDVENCVRQVDDGVRRDDIVLLFCRPWGITVDADDPMPILRTQQFLDFNGFLHITG